MVKLSKTMEGHGQGVSLVHIFRLALHLSLLLILGKYLEHVISFSFLIGAFLAVSFLVFFLYRLRLKSILSIPILLLSPWIIRLSIVLINIFQPSFLQIFYDMNFYLILVPLYVSSLLTWFSLIKPSFRKYEVLLNGFFLFLLFWKQGNYKITIVPNPVLLAIFSIVFILVELLVLYLSIIMEKGIRRNFSREFKEFSLFFLLLIPMIIYLLMPLWKIYEEGSVAGGGGLLKTSMFRFDFSEYIKLETEISMSDDLVLMYRKEGPAERMLLRRFVLSGYEKGQGFYRHERDKVSPPDKLLPRYTEYNDPGYSAREEVRQELFLVNIDPTAFLSLNYPVNSQPLYNWDNSSFVRIYQSDAMVATGRIRDLFPLISMEESDINHYTYTGDDREIQALAEKITEEAPGSLLKTMEIEQYFHKNYYYSLKPGVAPHGDQLSYFINESKKGYCSYFAFSMALMCRSLGIPARVAVGFWVDPDVSVLNFYPVRADQAHAWVEVYFNNYGWVEYDPTSGTMYPGEQYPFASFTIDEFSPLIEEILEHDLIPENLMDTPDDLMGDNSKKSPLKSLYKFLGRSWYFLLLFIYLLYISIYRYGYILLSHLNRGKRIKTRYLYLNMINKLSFERKNFKESAWEYAQRIEKTRTIPLVELTDLYLKSLFSPEYTAEDFHHFIQCTAETLAVYRKGLPYWKRTLFFLFPFFRSLHR
ncbi:MAG: transglutaminase domain-containing protein [Spirochaetaceae bacterium]|nr:transglutaminase domain-containing protein [Spirochaetaceae bacterium]